METCAGTGGPEGRGSGEDAAEGLSVRVRDSGRSARLVLAGYLDLGTAPLLREKLGRLLPREELTELVLDVTELSFCDAAGLAPMLKALLELRDRGGTLRLEQPQPALLRMLTTLHLAGDFGV